MFTAGDTTTHCRLQEEQIVWDVTIRIFLISVFKQNHPMFTAGDTTAHCRLQEEGGARCCCRRRKQPAVRGSGAAQPARLDLDLEELGFGFGAGQILSIDQHSYSHNWAWDGHKVIWHLLSLILQVFFVLWDLLVTDLLLSWWTAFNTCDTWFLILNTCDWFLIFDC